MNNKANVDVLNLYLPGGMKAIAVNAAAFLGYIATRGSMMGEGSPSQLMAGLINGEVAQADLEKAVRKARLKVEAETGVIVQGVTN